MTLLCRPKGRGNWAVIPVVLPSLHADFFVFKKGDTMRFQGPSGERVLRIVEVRP